MKRKIITTNLSQLSDIDIRHLNVFRSVVKAGGVTAAELDLNIGCSTISRHLKDLEIRLGMTLCHRGRAGFSLTEEGNTVYNSSDYLMAAINNFRHEVNSINNEITGTISIAMFDKTITNSDCFIYKTLKNFNKLAPKVNIEMYTLSLNKIEKGVINGLYQVGIIPAYLTSSSLEYISLFEETVSLYCGQGHFLFPKNKITKLDISKSQYAGLGYHSPSVHRANRLDLKRHATAFDQEGIATLVLSGQYIGFLPNHYAKTFVKLGKMRKIDIKETNYSCQFSAIYRKSPKPNRILKTFLDLL